MPLVESEEGIVIVLEIINYSERLPFISELSKWDEAKNLLTNGVKIHKDIVISEKFFLVVPPPAVRVSALTTESWGGLRQKTYARRGFARQKGP